jgi:putative ABC transport system permease protein
MKYFHLIWAALFRRKTRTLLTLASVVAAFLLFGMLDGARPRSTRPQRGRRAAPADVLAVVVHGQMLPLSCNRGWNGRGQHEAVTHANWFGGVYQDPKNFFPNFAVADNYLDLYPEMLVAPPSAKAWMRRRTGASSARLAKRFGWKIGDTIPLQATIFPNKTAATNWAFDMRWHFIKARQQAQGRGEPAVSSTGSTSTNPTSYVDGDVGWYMVKLRGGRAPAAWRKRSTRLSANSAHETKTQTEQAATSLRQAVRPTSA